MTGGPVLDAAVVTAIRHLASRGRGIKAIAREVGVTRNTVRRYLRQPVEARFQVRHASRRLSKIWREEAHKLFQRSAGGNAALVQRLLVERGIDVSVRTVQRVVGSVQREVRAGERQAAPGETAGEWEMDLVRATVKTIRTADAAELESELTWHAARLRHGFRSTVKDWKAFLATALKRKALNWIRDRQARDRKMMSLDSGSAEADDHVPSWEAVIGAHEPNTDLRLTLAGAAKRLPPRLRRLLRLLKETDGNLTEVARRLGIHRNTIRRWMRELQEAWRRLGL